MYKGQSITVIIPCRNEEQGIRRVLEAMPDFVDEVIVVDNNSTDRTHEVATALGAKVIHERLRGYGRSYKRGFANATGDLIVTLDGDRNAMSFKHKIGNLILSIAMSVLYLRWVRDSQSGMWVFRRSILADMKLESDGMAFSEEIKIEALKSSKVR